jgi:hypothetical protein
MSWLKKYDPLDFRNVIWKTKVDICTKMFLGFCTEHDVFINKKLNPVYWPISKTFKKCDAETLNKFYDYLYSLEKKHIQTFEQFFINVESYRQQQIIDSEKQKNEALDAKQYKPYDINDFLGL